MLLDEIAEGVLAFDEGAVMGKTRKALADGIDPKEIMVRGLAQGMMYVGERYERKELFVPDMLRASRVFNKGLELVLPYVESKGDDSKGKVVIGVIKGNTQDNGKNMVKIILSAHGFAVMDLGKNVAPRVFVDQAKNNAADFIGISVMTNSGAIPAREVVDLLVQEGIRDRFKVVIGGAAADEQLARSIGADGYAKDALAARDLLERFLNEKQ